MRKKLNKEKGNALGNLVKVKLAGNLDNQHLSCLDYLTSRR
nr:MAG TPA: hypothetical protein [Caudoviricetes sp.]